MANGISTPAYYVNCFRVMAKTVKENDGKMNFEVCLLGS